MEFLLIKPAWMAIFWAAQQLLQSFPHSCVFHDIHLKANSEYFERWSALLCERMTWTWLRRRKVHCD